MNAPEAQENINALASLLNAKGLDASDFIDVINALANIKKRDAEKEEKQEAKQDEPSNKFVKEKEYVYPGVRTDIFIFKNGNTKSGKYYVWIYDEKTKRRFTQSLRTTNRIESVSKGRATL